jgi:hypothetical protein
MHAWVSVYAGEGPNSTPLVNDVKVTSDAVPIRWESPALKPGRYYVRTATFYYNANIQPIYGLDRVVRVPAAKTKTARPA